MLISQSATSRVSLNLRRLNYRLVPYAWLGAKLIARDLFHGL